MPRGFLDKILVFMGIQEEPVEPATSEPVPERVGALRPNGAAAQAPGKAGTAQSEAVAAGGEAEPTEVTVLRLRVFEDVQLAADFLKGRRPVVVSLEGCERPLAQRMLDFLSGATFALDGHMSRLGEDIFMFTPSHITIGERGDAVRERGDAFGTRVDAGSEPGDAVRGRNNAVSGRDDVVRGWEKAK